MVRDRVNGVTEAVARVPGRTVMRQRSLRAANLAVVMHAVTSMDEPSRADIAARTGMTRSTVSRLADELIAGGLVQELAPISGQRGRPATPLVAARGTVAALGCELGVGHLTARVVDLAGQLLAHRHEAVDLARRPAAESLALLAELARDAADASGASTLVGVGLAVPGLVSPDAREVLQAPNLGWSDLAPAPLLAEAGLAAATTSLELINEADAAAVTLAQLVPGRPSERDAFLYVSGEVGVGSAAVLRGEVTTGRHGWAGELGHVCLDPLGDRCGCGATGCLETFAGRRAVLRAAGVDDLDALLARLASDDTRAVEAVRRAGSALGIAIAGALNLLDLQEVVLGGFLAVLGERVVPEIESELRARVLSHRYAPVRVSLEDGGEWRAATGSAHRVLAGVIGDPASWFDADTTR